MPTDVAFTGQRNDASTGLYFFNARYYSGALGRFVSADTIVPQPSNPASFNRFAYVGNSPLRYRDPSGHDRDCAIGDSECRRRVAAESTKSRLVNARVFYLNAIGNLGGNVYQPGPDPDFYEAFILHQVGIFVGPDNVTHIPVYTGGDAGATRWQMFHEAFFEQRIWSPIVADTIARELEARPLTLGERLVIIGESGGGTIAIEALDLLEERGIFVDQVILRGSLVQEPALKNVGRVDYITSDFDYYYSYDSNPYDAVDVHQHIVHFIGHVPPDTRVKKQVADLIAALVIVGSREPR
jgi:RHS repeat-associated protein